MIYRDEGDLHELAQTSSTDAIPNAGLQYLKTAQLVHTRLGTAVAVLSFCFMYPFCIDLTPLVVLCVVLLSLAVHHW